MLAERKEAYHHFFEWVIC
ncbi:hypothetical protein [Aneurinibacillus terranovensis]